MTEIALSALTRPRTDEIKIAICEHFGLRLSDMTSSRRDRHIARPRQLAMYLCRELTDRSLPEIGRLFGGRDHTTVLYARRKILRLFETDADLTVAMLKVCCRVGDLVVARNRALGLLQ